MLPKRVLIKWIDHGTIGDGGWDSLKRIKEEGPEHVDDPCWACGFLVNETKTSVTIVSQLSSVNLEDDDAQCSGDMTIAKCAILSIKELK